MKKRNPLRIIKVVILLIICFSCSEKNRDISLKEVTITNTVEPPRNGSGLNKSIYFNIDLKNITKYQPMHVEMCGNQSFVILGNFEKTKINFYPYNFQPKQTNPGDSILYIDKIVYARRKKDTIILNVLMEKTNKSQDSIDPIPFPIDTINLRRNNVIDLKLYLKSIEYECKRKKNVGDHICKSIIVQE